MSDKSTSSLSLIGSIPILSAIATLAITQNLYAVASMFMIAFVYDVTALIGCIPIVGVWLQWNFVTSSVTPWLMSTFVIPSNAIWIANIVFWISMVTGGILTVIFTILLGIFVHDIVRG
jgi:hypothetical protein